MAMDDLEIFCFVLEGSPDLWADGYLYRLSEGEGVTLNARTGLAHTLINNTHKGVRLFVMTEAFRRNSRATHPLDPSGEENLRKMNMFWADAPRRKLGPNKGEPGNDAGRKRGKPDFVVHWRDILNKKSNCYPKSDERQTLDARFDNRARFSRIGMRVQLLKPGRRTSWPHAERDEDEFVFVVSGEVDAWNDGHITLMDAGDFIGWAGGTGIAHVIINNGDQDAVLIVGGERSRMVNQYFYSFHRKYNEEIGAGYWADHPVHRLGPHDGMPDALRAHVPKRFHGDPVKANEATRMLGKTKKKK
ncbi:MAG: cupin domain-containing protein [Rhizomicrobium sp.]